MDNDMFNSNVQPKRVIKASVQDWLCIFCGYHNRFSRNCLDCGKEAPKND